MKPKQMLSADHLRLMRAPNAYGVYGKVEVDIAVAEFPCVMCSKLVTPFTFVFYFATHTTSSSFTWLFCDSCGRDEMNMRAVALRDRMRAAR